MSHTFEVKQISKEFIQENIDRFIKVASVIPGENWVLSNYISDLPGKWEYSIAAIDKATKSIIGFIIASDKTETIHIHKFAIDRNEQSKKVGLSLLQYLEKKIKTEALNNIVSLYVDVNNIRAKNFYEKNGFFLVEQVSSMFFYKKKLKVVVAIHQPNFFPWLGYFNKVASVDKFIILDHVNNKPSDGIYPKRVTIVCNSKPFWLTVPLVQPKDRLFIPLNEMIISTKVNFFSKHLKTIMHSYKNTPYFQQYFSLFQLFYGHESPFIVDRNITSIKRVIELLQLKAKLHISSDFNFSSTSNQLLVDLIKAVNGDTYLHGNYAISVKGYQDNDLFIDNGISLQLQQFSHPVYEQYNNIGEFIAGASIVDALMNKGEEEVAKFIMNQ